MRYFVLIFQILILFEVYSQKIDSCFFVPKKNSFKCLDNNKYLNNIKNNDIVMFGEIHGINQLPEFLSKALSEFSKKDSIIFAIELSEEQISAYNSNRNVALLKEKLFSKLSKDGKLNNAWLKMLASLNDNKKIIIKGIDINNYRLNRDSLMAENLKQLVIENPDKKIISLTGNLHNVWNNKFEYKTMAMYLNKILTKKKLAKTIAINFSWSEATARFDSGNGLEIQKLPEKNWSCKDEFPCENFLYKMEDRKYGYDYFLFFNKITAARAVE